MSELVVTAILRTFSSSNNNSEWEFYYNSPPGKKFFNEPLFYANGDCIENEGYVSITFHHSFGRLTSEFFKGTLIRCYMSVLDVNGKKRFTQSVVCDHYYINPISVENGFNFGLDRYIKRTTLLNDPGELLPGDCLTVCIDFDRIYPFGKRIPEDYLYNNEKAFCADEDEICIFLDTGFGRDLCRESEYFRCASDIPFIESITRKVRIEKEEEEPFMLILHIFRGSNVLEIKSISDIYHLYQVAEKYNIQSVIETCRQLIKAFLCTTEDPKVREHADMSVPSIWNLAIKYSDDDLNDIVQTYQKIKDNYRMNDYALGKHLKEKLYTEWRCDYRDMHYKFLGINAENLQYSFNTFVMIRFTESEFDFYK